MPYKNQLIEGINEVNNSFINRGINVLRNVENARKLKRKAEKSIKPPYRVPRDNYSNKPLEDNKNTSIGNKIRNVWTHPYNMFGRDIVRHNIGVPIRKFLGINKSTNYNQNDFSDEYLHTLDSIVDSHAKKNPNKKSFLVHAKDYANNYQKLEEDKQRSINNSLSAIQHTLGTFTVKDYTPYGYNVVDLYDFSRVRKPKILGNNYATIRWLAGEGLGTPEAANDNEKMKMNIHRYK